MLLSSPATAKALCVALHIMRRNCGDVCRMLYTAFAAMLAAVLARRERRCQAWLDSATQAFADTSEAAELSAALALLAASRRGLAAVQGLLRALPAAVLHCGRPQQP